VNQIGCINVAFCHTLWGTPQPFPSCEAKPQWARLVPGWETTRFYFHGSMRTPCNGWNQHLPLGIDVGCLDGLAGSVSASEAVGHRVKPDPDQFANYSKKVFSSAFPPLAESINLEKFHW